MVFPTIGVLAIQGDFAEHVAMLRQLNVAVTEVRGPEQLQHIDGLIIPGGESTTISRVAARLGMVEALQDFVAAKPTWGTCAGAILLAKTISGQSAHLGLMDITVARNAFGRQIDSFVTELDVKGLKGGPLRAVFIRAPIILSVGSEVDVLARLADGRIVAAREKHWLATAFHPELTPDTRMHQYFVDMVRKPMVIA